MATKFQLTGAKELSKLLKSVGGKETVRMTRNAVGVSATMVKKAAKSLVKKQKGDLRKSIISRKRRFRGTFVVAAVGSTSRKAHLIEFGVDRHLIQIKNKKVMSTGGQILGTKIDNPEHPGHPAFPFLRPALENNQRQVLDKMGDKFWQQLEAFVDKNTPALLRF